MRAHRNCCGLDVHKKIIAACLIREDAEGNCVTEKRLFGSMTRELHELAQWLCAAQVTAVAMEATGVYWMPVWNVLERYGLQLLLINPEHYKAVRGKKTDLKDGTRIAELLQDGRLEGSYVPPVAIRVLRDLTRYRVKLVHYQSAIANRIQKLLEQCNIKLASVASDALGVSAMAMLRALAQGETDAVRMAGMAKRQLRKKIPQLQLALEGCLLPHHRLLLGEMIEDLDHVGTKITRIEETIEQQMRPFQDAVNRWLTVPGIKHRLAWTLVAEVGPTVEAFPSAADIVSWAGVCPGNNQTAGKRKSGTTRAGNPWLRRALCEAAWAASKSKGTYLQAQFRHLAALRGSKRALIAVANSILTAGYYMLQRGTTYQELGPDHFDKRNTVRAPVAWLNASKHSGTGSSSNLAFPLIHYKRAAVRRNFLARERYDFGSLLRFIEDNFANLGLREGELGFADSRTTTDFSAFLHTDLTPRPFTTVNAAKTADFFINDPRPPEAPDND